MSRRPLRAAVKHHVSAFNIDNMRLLNRVDRDTDTDKAAKVYMTKNNAVDLLEMLDLS